MLKLTKRTYFPLKFVTIGPYTKACKKETEKEKPAQTGRASRSSLPPKLKFTFKEQKEFDEIDSVIAELEEKIQNAEKEMAKASADFVRLQELMDEKAHLEEELAEKMERWVYLNDLNDRIQAQGKSRRSRDDRRELI